MNERLPAPVLRFSQQEAEAVVKKYETDGGVQVTAGEQQLLDRYFLEHEDEELSKRYREALGRFGSK